MSPAPETRDADNVVLRWAQAWSAQDTPLFLGLFADDARYCDVALDKVFHGQEALRAFFEGTFETFPDFRMEVASYAVNETTAAGQWTMSGTFLGASFGEPPTGKSFRVQGCCFMRLLDGRIVEHHDYWNPAAFERQVKP